MKIQVHSVKNAPLQGVFGTHYTPHIEANNSLELESAHNKNVLSRMQYLRSYQYNAPTNLLVHVKNSVFSSVL